MQLRLERLPVIGAAICAAAGARFPSNVRFGDIIAGLPVLDGSVTGVYCSHVLEHLPRDSLLVALTNTFKMLKPGGIFRLVVPDLQWRAASYLAAAARNDPGAADMLMEAALLGRRKQAEGLLALIRSYHSKSFHLWMYDFAALRAALEQVGFVDVRRCELHDCEDARFLAVEDEGRFFEHGKRELAIEARRPALR